MTAAEIVEREWLARRAPVPVQLKVHEKASTWVSPNKPPYPWLDWSSPPLQQRLGDPLYAGLWPWPPARSVALRMSDGSLVIVRRKEKAPEA